MPNLLTDDERHTIRCAVLDAIDKAVQEPFERLGFALPSKPYAWVTDNDLPTFLPALDKTIDAACQRIAAKIREKPYHPSQGDTL